MDEEVEVFAPGHTPDSTLFGVTSAPFEKSSGGEKVDGLYDEEICLYAALCGQTRGVVRHVDVWGLDANTCRWINVR